MNSRKIIAVVHAGGSPHHGPNTRWYYLGQALRRQGIEVEIVSSSFFHKYVAPPHVEAPLETRSVDGLPYHWIRTRRYRSRGLGQLANQWDFVRGCRRFSRQLAARSPSVVVAVSPHPFSAISALRIARLADVPFVFEIHDLWPQVLIELGRIRSRHPYAIALRAAERFAVRHADRIVSLKRGDVDYLAEEHSFRRDRFIYSPNGVLPSATSTPVPEAFAKVRARHRILVGYVGAISAYYRLESLVELAARFRDRSEVGFVVVGKGDLRDRLTRRVTEAGLRCLHVLDAVPPTAVPSILSSLDIGYVSLADLPLHRFGISCTKIADYMQAGLPILGMYRAAHDPVTAAGCGLVFPPDDIAGAEAGLAGLVGDPATRSAMSDRARRHFENHFDIERVAASLAADLFGSPTSTPQGGDGRR